MKKISILIPCLNEEDNVEGIANEVIKVFNSELSDYDYDIVFIDNYSTDETRNKLRNLCKRNNKIKAIFNLKNFGPSRSPVYGMLQTDGDCTIQMACDFQEPPEVIPQMVRLWENGNKIVIAKRSKSTESLIMKFCRGMFYKIFNKIGDIEHIEYFCGFGLYDKSFLDTLRKIDDPIPYLRGLVTEVGPEYAEVEFEQPVRKTGKSKTNFLSLYNVAMLGFTTYSNTIPRLATILGAIGLIFCIPSFIVSVFFKIISKSQNSKNILRFILNITLSLLNLFFIGIIGEYLVFINQRIMHRPLVIEQERINF